MKKQNRKGERINVRFRPYKRGDGKYVLELYCEQKSLGFLMWIESSDWSMVHVNRADMAMQVYTLIAEASATCEWLQGKYDAGSIKNLHWEIEVA